MKIWNVVLEGAPFWNASYLIQRFFLLGTLTNCATIAITMLQVKTYVVTPLEGKSYTTSSTVGVMT